MQNLGIVLRPALWLLLLFAPPALAAEEPDGAAILKEFSTRHQVPYEFETVTLKLTDAQGNETTRVMRRYARKWDEGKYRHLVVFDEPSTVHGTALLAWQNASGPDHQWTYLPAQNRVRKQSATRGNLRQYFMGTDLTYEDISAEDVEKYAYERQPDQQLDGVDVFVVRARPSDPDLQKETGYQHRDLFLRKDNFVLVRVDFYDMRGKFVKRLLAKSEPVSIGETAWRVDHVLIDNEREQHKTELIVNARQTDEDAVPKNMFSSQYIAAKRHFK